MKLALALCALIALTFFMSCDPALLLGPQASMADKYKLRATYHRGSCYGRCEVYGLNVYENGLLMFTGERFTDRPGTWSRNVDRREVVALLDKFEQAGFTDYPRSFRSTIADAPTIDVGYYDAAGTYHTTSYQDNIPKELEEISGMLHRLAHLEDYKQVTDTIANRRRPVTITQKPKEEIIVELTPGLSASTWVIAYGKQNVALKNRVSPNGNYYIITADPNLMGADELLEYLRKDAAVLSAQRNLAVNPRK